VSFLKYRIVIKGWGKLPDLLITRPGCLVYPFAVDDMKRLQGWSDVMITHFHELAIYGEQILLSIRYGDWIDINDQELARNWARYWRPEIQRYTMPT
jgi:hypothetical protein